MDFSHFVARRSAKIMLYIGAIQSTLLLKSLLIEVPLPFFFFFTDLVASEAMCIELTVNYRPFSVLSDVDLRLR
jgi:hypothetical protein